jgi:endonuclease/exonuclease/phosphatase family metal-dependent hydrolase
MQLTLAPPGLMAGYTVNANLEFFLLAVWPVKTPPYSYHDVIRTALERYRDQIQSGRAIMAGDFNSSTRVLNQKRSHPEFVRTAESLGLTSAYHAITGEAHGQESVATYRHGKGSAKEFHLDYFFASTPLLPSARFEVLQGPYWEGLSDHFPIVLDLQD